MAKYNSGVAFALGNSANGDFTANSNGTLKVYWSGTANNLTFTIDGVAVIVAVGAASPANHGEVEMAIAGGQTVNVATGAALSAIVTSVQRLA